MKYMKMRFFALLSLPVLTVGWSMCSAPENQDSENKVQADSVYISNDYFSGTLHNNASNKKRQGAGFNPLTCILYPKQNIYRDDAVGLNFEHIMNGAAADADISMFTPRRDSCYLKIYNDSTASIIHNRAYSTWGAESEMIYQFNRKYYLDLDFTVTLKKDKFPLGYIGFMWASYMNCTLDRRIYFIGMNKGSEEWMAFGENTQNGFETGTIGAYSANHLPYEQGAKTLNLIEDPLKKFVYPFYYGLVHGSGNISSGQDTMVYIMMFNQKESIRFAMWNFFRNAEGYPDTHSPAWDWQYVIRSPQLNKPYHYRARIVYKPFAGREDIENEYRKWLEVIGK